MNKIKEFPFKQARRVIGKEVEMARKAIEAKLGVKRPSRGQQPASRRKDAVLNIRINSQDLTRLKQKAKTLGVPYQTFISELLHRYAT